MKRFNATAAIVVSLVCLSPDQASAESKSSVDDRLNELVRVENSATSENAAGTSLAAFSRIFDDNIVMFAIPVPGFGIGKEQALSHLGKALGSPAATIRWTPSRAGLSADGQHGYSFGYTEAQVGNEPKLGKYVAYWVRSSEGWRVALLKLVPRTPGAKPAALELAIPNPGPWTETVAKEPQILKAELAAREQAFSDEAERIGLGPAFEKFGSADAVNSGGEAGFVKGNKAIGELHGTGPSPLHWAADGGVLVAGTGDLGVTWGMLKRNGPTPPGRLAEIPFFTIWRRASPTAPWLYVAE